jgi:hypothetical protein
MYGIRPRKGAGEEDVFRAEDERNKCSDAPRYQAWTAISHFAAAQITPHLRLVINPDRKHGDPAQDEQYSEDDLLIHGS